MSKPPYFHFYGHGAVHWRPDCPGAKQAETQEHLLPDWPHKSGCGCGTQLERECSKCAELDATVAAG